MGYSPWGREESDTTERLHFDFSLSCTGEGNGNPLQCSCLENPRDGGACWAAVYGVAQSRIQLLRLSSSSSLPGVLLCCSAHQAHRGGPLAGVLLCKLAGQALKGAPWVGSCSVIQCIRCLMGHPLYCSAADAGSDGRERLWWWVHPQHVTQLYRLASMAAGLFSTDISHHHLLPHIP